MNANPPKRVQIDLQEQSMAQLNELRRRTEAASYSEVVRRAIRLYEAVLDEADAGNKLFVRRPEGEFVEIKFL